MAAEPRIGVAGFLHESNSFLPVRTSYEHFASTSLTRGEEMRALWGRAAHELGGMISARGAVPLYATYAVPSGPVEAEAFERICDEILESIRLAGHLDGLLLALHGATVADGYPDADGELLRRVRVVFGGPVMFTFDLHANLSLKMIGNADAAVGYRTNPHVDQRERGAELAALMRRMLAGDARPVMALETPPMLLRNSRQNTAAPPARGLYDDLREVLSWPGILSASVAMGFPHSDVEEVGAGFVAVADGDIGAARRAAKWMARRAWERRAEFTGPLTSVEEAVRRAGLAERGPVVLLDVGDNVGGGSAGNSMALFDELRRQGVRNGLVVLYDPEAVKECVTAGVRNRTRWGRVRTIADGIFEETQVRHGGWSKCDQGITAVVETEENHTMVFTSRRMAPFSLEQLLSLGIHPERKRVLIVKGVIAPRAAYEPVAAEFILVDTPGETADDPALLPYTRRRKPLYPLEADAEYPG